MHHCHLVLTSKCNQNCQFCLVKSKIKADLSFRQAAFRLKKARSQGAVYLSIDGGEPTLFPRFEDLILTAKSLGFKQIAIKTNGLGFSNYEFAKHVLKENKNLIKIYLSLHSADNNIQDKLTQVKGGFHTSLKAIRNIVKLNGNLVVNIVICTLNYEHLKRYIDLLEKLKVKKIIFLFIIPRGNALKHKYLIPPIESTIPYIKEAIDYANTKNIIISLTFFPFCLLDRYKRYAVEFNIAGTIQNFDELFNEKYRSKACRECIYYEKCPEIWKEYYELRGFKFKPIY